MNSATRTLYHVHHFESGEVLRHQTLEQVVNATRLAAEDIEWAINEYGEAESDEYCVTVARTRPRTRFDHLTDAEYRAVQCQVLSAQYAAQAMKLRDSRWAEDAIEAQRWAADYAARARKLLGIA